MKVNISIEPAPPYDGGRNPVMKTNISLDFQPEELLQLKKACIETATENIVGPLFDLLTKVIKDKVKG